MGFLGTPGNVEYAEELKTYDIDDVVYVVADPLCSNDSNTLPVLEVDDVDPDSIGYVYEYRKFLYSV
jgi:hypothetical protein